MIKEEYKYLIPEESNGVITENVNELRKVEAILRNTFNENNFSETLIPLFEYVDLYKSVYSNFDEEKIFKYIGKDGKVIALRWDFTIPLARHYFLQGMSEEAKFSYFGKVYRKEKNYIGRSSESHQAGIEIVNKKGIEGNIECINILQNTIKELKLTDTKLELGSAKFFNRICELVDNKDELIEILSKRNISEMERFIVKNNIKGKLKELFLNLPRLCGKIEMLNSVIDYIEDETLLRALKELKLTYNQIEKNDNVIFDLAMCPTMEYYTCLMFKMYSPYSPEPIVSGGRYDSLYKNFERDVPAIGMGYYIDNILKVLRKEGELNGKNSNN